MFTTACATRMIFLYICNREKVVREKQRNGWIILDEVQCCCENEQKVFFRFDLFGT